MKALVFSTKVSGLLDSYNFIKNLEHFLGKEIEIYGAIPSNLVEDKKNSIRGFEKIFLLEDGSTVSYANTLNEIDKDLNSHLFVGSMDKNGLDVVCRISSDKDIPMITEVSIIEEKEGNILLGRPIIGGRVIAKYRFSTPIAITVAGGKFKAGQATRVPEFVSIDKVDSPVRVLNILPKEKGSVELSIAEIIIGVGRGFKDKNDLKMAFELAELIGGEVGCSRPIAADLQWLGEDRWIGISGKKIRGKLYIAIGISGAPQHIMAASDTKIIVAINKDKNAPIFNFADYGVVADLYQFLPVFINKLKDRLS